MTKKPFSKMEERVMAALPKGGAAVTTAEIAAALWGTKLPSHATIRISAVVRSLCLKTKRGSPRVMRGGRRGPYPGEVWLQK